MTGQELEEKMEIASEGKKENDNHARQPKFTEEMIKELITMTGESRERVIEALTICEADLNAAASYLLG